MRLNKTFIVLLLVLSLFLVSGQAGCPAKVEEPVKATGEQQPPIEQEPSIEITSAPAIAEFGKPITITWKISGPSKTIKHTAIHYDKESNPGSLGLDITPDKSYYDKLTLKYAQGDFQIPGDFSTEIEFKEVRTFYYRAHMIIDGKNYWTEEKSLAVKTSASSPTKELTIEADDAGFYTEAGRIKSIFVSKNDLVKITFNVRSEGVYYGGLDFRGCGQSTPGTKPGQSAKFEFTATDICEITSYWPVSNVKKDTLQVVVQ